jgi:hypothetical protein
MGTHREKVIRRWGKDWIATQMMVGDELEMRGES